MIKQNEQVSETSLSLLWLTFSNFLTGVKAAEREDIFDMNVHSQSYPCKIRAKQPFERSYDVVTNYYFCTPLVLFP